MAITEDLAVQYHQQDTDYYCGAACAQMVLEQCGQGLLDQDDLYNDNHSHSTTEGGWATAPDGLTWTLNNRQSGRYFVLDALANEDSSSRMICWTIHHYRIAPVAMVYGWAHWIAVRGYEASAAPMNSLDTAYTITGLFVNNPWPPVPVRTPPLSVPPHTATDGCGSGGDRGVADEHISYATWQTDYMTGIPSGHWAGKFVAVCDPDPPPRQPGARNDKGHRSKGDRIISSADAVKRAFEGLQAHNLAQRPAWKGIAAKPVRAAGESMLVKRLDRADDYYYIVPVGGNRDTPAAAVSVDARFGTYRESVAFGSNRKSTLAIMDRSTAAGMVLGKRFDLEDHAGRILVRREAVCQYPVLVWKPCRESLSPFYPFHMFTVGARRIYVRVDGKVFTTLHDQDRGI